MATLQPIGWLRSTHPNSSGLYGRRYTLSSSEIPYRDSSGSKIAVFQVDASSDTGLTVSAQISESHGDELGGLQCFLISVPTAISASNSVFIESYMQLAEQHTTVTSSTFTFNISHSGYLGVCVGSYIVGSTREVVEINSVSYGSDSGSGSGSGSGSSSYSDIENFLRATPRSPSGGTSVYALSPVEFTWSLSKRLNSAEYDGSTLQYRYGSSGAIQTLGSVNYDIAVFNYETGFNNNSQVQWRVRAAVKISSEDLRAGGYTDTQLRNAGYEVIGYSGSGSVDEIVIGEDGEVVGGSSGDKCTIHSPWSEWTTFQVGDAKVYEATVTIVGPTDDRNGAERIIFKYDIRSDGAVSGSQCQYSLDGGYNWTSLPEQGAKSSVEIPVKAKTFPAGTVRWRARAKANGSYTDNWATASFRVTYDGYGKIVVTQGPIKVGIRRNTRIPVTAGLKAVGNIGNALSFSSAQFCWSSGTGDSFAAIEMPVSGDTASVIIPANTFPSGIIQWYLKGTDATNVSSETPIYTAYILNNVIDSFPVRPINNISNSDTSLEFVWGYISEDGEKHTKSEIQFSEDGINWNDPIEV